MRLPLFGLRTSYTTINTIIFDVLSPPSHDQNCVGMKRPVARAGILQPQDIVEEKFGLKTHLPRNNTRVKGDDDGNNFEKFPESYKEIRIVLEAT